MKYNPYSISKFGTFESCNKKFKLQYIDKIKIEKIPQMALERGLYFHTIIENNYDYNIEVGTNDVFTEDEKQKCYNTLKNFEYSEIGKFYKEKADIPWIESKHEEKFGFKVHNTEVISCDYWDKDCWIRGAIDFYYIEDNKLYIVDWKSGKDKSKDNEFGIIQAMAYTIYMFIKYPNINNIQANFVFIEHSTQKVINFNRNKFNKYIKYFYNKTKNLEKTEIFKENVSALCEYCDFKDIYCSSFKENEEKSKFIMNTKVSLDF